MMLMLCVGAAFAEEGGSALPVDFTPGMPLNEANFLSETEYEDPTIHVVVESGRTEDCDYWVARITISDPSQLRTAAAGGFESNDFTMNGVYLAKRQNAVLAVDGDYYSYHPDGMVVRQGVMYRNALRGERDVLVIDEDGDFHIFSVPKDGEIGETVDGKKAVNVFHFGPGLVIDGEIANLSASSWMVPTERRQRMCIAQTGPLEYMALCCAGPLRGSYGMDLKQFATLAKELGAINAYNLDGGDSTMLYFNGEMVNTRGNSNPRKISDIIYFASAWDGQ